MSFWEVVILLVIAGVAGALGQALSGFSVGGCFLSIVVGFIGALIGSWLARELGLPDFFVLRIDEIEFPVLWSIIGAALFTAVVGLLAPRRID
jgi:uncharacterized membrane protein YeaQ/YmgE (transglycosylase-associated protein family)